MFTQNKDIEFCGTKTLVRQSATCFSCEYLASDDIIASMYTPPKTLSLFATYEAIYSWFFYFNCFSLGACFFERPEQNEIEQVKNYLFTDFYCVFFKCAFNVTFVIGSPK